MISNQFTVEIDKQGAIIDQEQVNTLLAGLTGVSDLLVLAHGWNNTMARARELYDDLTAKLHPLTEPASAVAVARVFWPSKAFTDAELMPGGGAASAEQANDEALRLTLESLKRDPDRLTDSQAPIDPVRAASIDRAEALVDELEISAAARHEFVLCIRAVLNPDDAHPDDGSQEFFADDPEELFDRLSGRIRIPVPPSEGGVAAAGEGGVAFIGDLLSGVKAAARRIGNFAGYYQMKTRAGVVGEKGVATTLARIRERHPALPVHLVGHSFGGRLVTAAASSLQPGGAPVTMTLLQAAFSHNGLAQRFDGEHDGAYRRVLSQHRVSGPIAVTHTRNDKAVGIAYPLASRLKGDNAAGVGEADDPYGGMGRNGAQHTPEVDRSEAALRPAGNAGYAFVPGKVYNLNADRFIAGHSAVTGDEVVRLIAAMIKKR